MEFKIKGKLQTGKSLVFKTTNHLKNTSVEKQFSLILK